MSSKIATELSFDSEHKRRAENLAFDIDVWYPKLKKFTMKTEFIPLTLEQAQAVVRFYRSRYLHKNELNLDDIDNIQKLTTQMDNVIRTHFSKGGAFIRLCGRSLKDADCYYPGKCLERYEKIYDELKDSAHPDTCLPMKVLHRVEWMKVESGKEAMNLLLSSERAYVDLQDWIDYGEPEQIVLREWLPEMTQDWEFRAYVSKGKLTCISQYEHYCYYPYLTQMKEKIQKMIQDKVSEVHNFVGNESYIVDFAYLHSTDSLILVELGPMLPCSGPHLFNWKRDAAQLEYGDLEFRLGKPEQVTRHEDIGHLIQDNWVEKWKKAITDTETYDKIIDSSLEEYMQGENRKMMMHAATVIFIE